MKKLLCILLLLMILLLININVHALGTTYTGEGLSINLYEPEWIDQAELIIDNELIDKTPSNLIDNLQYFNCHFFTFFICVPARHSSINNDYYCLNSDVNKFLKVGDYVDTGLYAETDRYHAEIIAYYSSNGNLFHTGRVTEAFNGTPISNTNDSNLVTVVSKWDNGYIYEHRGDLYCSHNELTNYSVKYFSYSCNHTHNYSYSANDTDTHNLICGENLMYCKLHICLPHTNSYISNNNLTHNIVCSDCNYQISTDIPHVFNYSNLNANYHTKYCIYCNYNIQESHDWYKVNDLIFRCNNCNAIARYIPIIHNSIYSPMYTIDSTIIYYNGTYYLLIMENNLYE